MPQRFHGAAMRDARRAADLTITELSDRIAALTGRHWHRNHLYGIESGRQQPGLHLSHAIAKALNIPWAQLMTPSDGGGGYRVVLHHGETTADGSGTTPAAALDAALTDLAKET